MITLQLHKKVAIHPHDVAGAQDADYDQLREP